MLTGIDGCWRECETKVKKQSRFSAEIYIEKLHAELLESSENVKHVLSELKAWASEHRYTLGMICSIIFCIVWSPVIIPASIWIGLKKAATTWKMPWER